MAEQGFCKAKVEGSNPFLGSENMAESTKSEREDVDTVVDRLKAASIVDRRKTLEAQGVKPIAAGDQVRQELRGKDFRGEGWELRKVAEKLIPEKNKN